MNPPSILIRVDGGPDIGFGHVVRTSALANELLRRGCNVTYATTSPEPVAMYNGESVGIRTLSSRDDVSGIIEILDEGIDSIILDIYEISSDDQRRLREHAILTHVSDDARLPICSDLLVNGNIYAPVLDYEVVGQEPIWYLGPEYLLLRNAISHLSLREPPWRDPPELALITMGGSDIADQTPKVLQAFDGLRLHVAAIVGPGFSQDQEEEMRAVASQISTGVDVIRDPKNLPELMLDADFAVTTASSTVYELLTIGTPFICKPVVGNQLRIAAELSERDLATVIDRDDGLDSYRRAIRGLISDPTLRRRRQESGRDLIDGRGAKRVATEVLSLIGNNA